MVAPIYQPRDPSATILYQVVAENLETFLAGAPGLPRGADEDASEPTRREIKRFLLGVIGAPAAHPLGQSRCGQARFEAQAQI
jgi:hypothetical protein